MRKRRGILVLVAIVIAIAMVLPGNALFYQGEARAASTETTVLIKNSPGLEDISGITYLHRYRDFSLVKVDSGTLEKLRDDGLLMSALPKRTTIYVNKYVFDVMKGEPNIPENLKATPPSPGERALYIVHMIGPIPNEWTDELKKIGAEIITYIPNYAYEVRMTPEERTEVEKLSFVDWIGYYHPAYKIAPNFDSDFASVDFLPSSAPSIKSAAKAARNYMGVRFEGKTMNGYRMVGFVSTYQDLENLAKLPDVQYVGPYHEPHLMDEMGMQIVGGGAWYFDDDNDINTPYRAYGNYGAYVNQLGYNGTGVIVGIADTGLGDGTTPNAGHNDFTGRVLGGYDFGGNNDWSDGHGHGTHCAGLMAADGYHGNGIAYAGFGPYYVGMGLANNAQIYAERIFDSSGSWIGPSDDYLIPKYAKVNAGVEVHSNSWGSSSGGAYGDSDSAYDHAVRDADNDTAGNQEMVLVVAAGNDGSATNTIGSPGNAKNIITVGAVENYMPDAGSYGDAYDSGSNPDAVTSFSSRGWTDDGRIKPDIVTPGQATLSTHSPIISGSNLYGLYSEDGRYEWCTGTSQATPTAAGGAAVVYGWYKDTYGVAPSPAMVKGLIINTAIDIGTPDIPNQDEGWGRMYLPTIIDPPAPFVLKDQQHELTTGVTDSFNISYVNSSEPLKISLVYTDTYAASGATVTLQNNLDLEVISPSGKIYHGNAFTGGWSVADTNPSSTWDTDGDGYDDRNNVECVYINTTNLETGTYTVKVIGANVPTDSDFDGTNDQDYALIMYNAAEDSNPPVFSGLQSVTDTGTGYSLDLTWTAATDNEGSYPITYNIYRATTSGGEDFTAPTATYTPTGVSPGDTITWTDTGLTAGTTYYYVVRAQDSLGNEETNTVEKSGTPTDTSPPTFNGLENVTNIGDGSSLKLTWSAATDASPPITYNIYRATTPGGEDFTAPPLASTTDTYYIDTGLTTDTTYYYVVRAQDSNGYEDTNTVERSGAPFIQWWLQIETSAISGYQNLTDLSVDPLDTGATETTGNISGAGQYQVGGIAWMTEPLNSDSDVAGNWTFNTYGNVTIANKAHGYLYAKVYQYNGGSPTLLFQTLDDDEDIANFTSSHLFTWTYNAPSSIVPSGDRIYVEIWLDIISADAGGTVQVISNPTFDTDSSGWTVTNGGSATGSYDSATGNPAGSIYATVSGSNFGSASGTVTWETNFTYDLGIPTSASLSFDRYVSAFSADTNNQYTFYLITPSGTQYTIYPTTTYSATDTAWVSVTNYSIDTSYFSESGTYTLQIYVDMSAARRGTTTVYFDNVYLDIVSPPAEFLLQYDDPSTDSNVIPALTAGAQPTMSVSFVAGWNLVSLPWLTSATDINTALSGLSWTRAMIYQNGVWKTYDINRDARYNLGFPTVDNTVGIWVYVTSDGTLTENEPSVTSTDIPLSVGWNLVGYPSNTVDTVGNVMAGFTGTYDYIETYDTTTGTMIKLTATDNMEPGRGYWIHVTSPGTWTVNW